MSELSISGFLDGGALPPNPISPVEESPSLFSLETALRSGSRAKNFSKKISILCCVLPTNLKLLTQKQISLLLRLSSKCRSVKQVFDLLNLKTKRIKGRFCQLNHGAIETALFSGSRAQNFEKKICALCLRLDQTNEVFSDADKKEILMMAKKCRCVASVSLALGIQKKEKKQSSMVAKGTRPRRKGILSDEEYRKYVRESKRIARRKRLETDIGFRIRCSLRNRLRRAIEYNRKSGKTVDLLGCNIPSLKTHLEAKWKPGMSWENYGTFGWHIDHIRPCASFDLSDPLEQAKCFHYKNLQPLWAKENIAKGAKYDLNQA